MSIALDLKLAAQAEVVAAMQATIEGLTKRCDDLEARLETKIEEFVEERTAAPPIPIPPLSPTLRALGIGHQPKKKAAREA